MRRLLIGLARAVAAGLLLLGVALTGVVLGLDAPVVRRLVVARVNLALASTFAGRVTVESLGGLGLTSLRGVSARVEDPTGRTVLRVEGVSVRVSTFALFRSVLGGGEVAVTLRELSVARAEVSLDVDDAGTLRVAQAFAPRSQAPSTGASRGVRLEIARASVGHASIHREVDGRPPVEVGLDGVYASVRVVQGALAVDVEEPRLTAHFADEQNEIRAALDVPALKADDVRALWPESPFTEDGSVHVEAKGTLPRLAFRARASVGRGALAIEGPIVVGDDVRADLHVVATSIDAHALSGSAPVSDLSASGDVSLVAPPGGGADADVVLDAGEGSLAGSRIPPATIRGHVAYDARAKGHVTATAALAIRVPGAPIELKLRLAPKGESFELSVDGRATVPRFDAVQALGRTVRGRATAVAHGELDIGTRRLDANARAAIEEVRLGGVRLSDATVDARASGALASPRADVTIAGDGLDVGALHFSAVRGRAEMTLDGGVTLRGVEVSVERDGRAATVHAPVVRFAEGEVRVDDAVVEGVGSPLRVSLRQSPGQLIVRARSQRLDVRRLAQIAGVQHVEGGWLSVDVDATIRASTATGHAVLDLADGSAGGWHDASAHVDVKVDGRRASGHVAAALGDVGSIDVRSPSIEAGPSWARVWGVLDIVAHVDLAKLAARSSPATLPLGFGGGASHVLDAAAHLQVDRGTGLASVDARLADPAGDLVVLAATSDSALLARLVRAEGGRLEALDAIPFDAILTVPSRDLSTLPAAIGAIAEQGRVEATVRWRGTLAQPSVDVTAGLRGVRTDVRVLAAPIDLDLTAHYGGGHVVAALQASARDRRVLDASASADVLVADVLQGLRGAPVPWTASARGHLSAFPLRSIGALDDYQVRGRASGDFVLDGLHRDAHATLALVFDALQVGDIVCREAGLQASVDGRSFDASGQVDHGDGGAQAHGHFGTHWGSAALPAVDTSQPVDVSGSVKAFRVELLEPLFAGLFADLDGRLTGSASVRIDPRARTMTSQGTVALQDGVFELATLGGEFHDVSGKITLTPDGVVRVEDVTARGLSGRLQAAATARFSGLAFGGASATLVVPRKEPMPVVVEGVNLGVVDGRLDVTATPGAGGSGIDVTVGVPTMHVQLPASAAHEVQALGELDRVRFGVSGAPTGSADMSLDRDGDTGEPAGGARALRAPVRVAVKLGGDVEVKRGADLDVYLAGEPTFTVADAVGATGRIRLVRGTIDVQGKPFVLEEGTVTFVGDDPSNPQVVLTAAWTAPDGTTVYADFRGPLRTGRVTLRADPARSHDEILALILFGTTDTSASAGGASPQATPAVAAAGGAATQPINRMLDGFGLAGGVSTKIDTSTTNPRPEVEVQIAREVTLQVALVLGVPPPGSNPDTVLATLNWRFLRRWSLETTVGNAGSSILDLVWQHRY